MPMCRDCAEQDGFDGMCLAKGEYKTPSTPACELFFASNAAELKGLRVLNRELRANNAKLRELVREADRLMQGVLDNATDTVVVSDLPCCDTLFDNLCDYRLKMLKLGFELSDTRIREMRELGIEVDDG